jgi:hypothetical protein
MLQAKGRSLQSSLWAELSKEDYGKDKESGGLESMESPSAQWENGERLTQMHVT